MPRPIAAPNQSQSQSSYYGEIHYLYHPLIMPVILRIAAATAAAFDVYWCGPQRTTIIFGWPSRIDNLNSSAKARNNACEYRRGRTHRRLFWLWMCTFRFIVSFLLDVDKMHMQSYPRWTNANRISPSFLRYWTNGNFTSIGHEHRPSVLACSARVCRSWKKHSRTSRQQSID